MNDYHKLWNDLSQLVDQIKNESIKRFTIDMVHSASDVWQRPASHSHHLLDERETHGNLLHTVRVASLCKLICEAVEVQSDTGYDNEDILLSAAILHDMCRYGLFGSSETSRPDHPKLVRLFAEEKGLSCDHFDEVMEAVESHMGQWSENPVILVIDPSTALHLADCIVARWAEVMPSGSERPNGRGTKE